MVALASGFIRQSILKSDRNSGTWNDEHILIIAGERHCLYYLRKNMVNDKWRVLQSRRRISIKLLPK